MKPAICSLCGKAAIDEPQNDKGDWVQFSDFEIDSTENLSHPKGLEYFCNEHLTVAMTFVTKTSEEAHSELMALLGTDIIKNRNSHRSQSAYSLWSRISAFFK